MEQKFDLIIIGGGAGAFAAAIKANELGAKTVLVNKGLPLGGTCVNVGCVPSKTLLWAGEVIHQSQNHGIDGIEIEVKSFDFLKVVQHELSLVEKMREEKYQKVLNNLDNVTFVEGRAKFVSQNEIEVNGPHSAEASRGKQKLQADKFIISTGSTARLPNIDGINETGFITHIEALKLEKQPRELVVIGAGPLGLEFAQMYSRFGTKVTMLQRSESIFSPGERELTNKLSEILRNEGITIHTGVELKLVSKNGERKTVKFTIGGQEQIVEVDEILLASGKSANTSELGLESVGVEVDKHQAVVVNDFYQTLRHGSGQANPNIFAVGDVAALPLRLETTAGREGTYAAENALRHGSGQALKSINYDEVPYTIFTDPQFASIGLSEEEQMKRMNTCACRTVSFSDVPKGQVIGRTEGLIKMAIHPEGRQILGVHVLAPNAGDLIAQAMVLIKNKNTIDDVVDSLPVFPTLSEAIKIAALSFTQDISKLSCCI